jgi:transcriptional regulator with XRE-family HTH domain
LTQSQLAERAATSQATVSAYESGRKQPSAQTFVRLLAATGTRLAVSETPSEPVRTLSRAERRSRGQILEQVIELAEALPARPSRDLRYPRIRDLIKPGLA